MPSYYPINETLARQANMMNSYYAYKPGSATAEYRAMVDKAAAIAEEQKSRTDPMYHEKIDYLLDTYARKLAENFNENFEIQTRCPSILVAGRANFPIRKKEKQNGGMTYDPEHIRRNGLEDALDRVREIVGETLAYMRQMETAPPLLAEGLSVDYRLLAEFNHIVLAGHAREGGYGVEFITWERIRNNTGLWQGHYYDNGYAATKQDFAVRSGLLPSSQIFTKEQLAVIYDAAQNITTLDLVSNPQQGKLLEGIMEQIEQAVPQVIELANELTQSPKHHEHGEMQLY